MTAIDRFQLQHPEPGDYREHLHISGAHNVAWDIAQRLYLRHRLGGPEYIIADRPGELLSLLRKHWAKLMRQTLAKRASLNDGDTEGLIELSRQISYMQNLRITDNLWESLDAGVIVLTPQMAVSSPPVCTTLYITSWLSMSDWCAVVSLMPIPRLIVAYASTSD